MTTSSMVSSDTRAVSHPDQLMPDKPLVSIVIPTYCEVDNLTPLVERIFGVIREADFSAEVIFVDDNSGDGSTERVAALRARDFPVEMVVRQTERGLSTAVLKGFDTARGDILLVMDADLSHPPEKIPELVRAVRDEGCEFVIGSRYVDAGQTKDWPLLRKLNSQVATLLARGLTPIKDPMAGFFCLPTHVWRRCATLNPLGYKIGLELVIKGKCSVVREIPIIFTDRHSGESKLTLNQQLLYLVHLKRLYWFKFPVLAPLLCIGLPLLVLGALTWNWLS